MNDLVQAFLKSDTFVSRAAQYRTHEAHQHLLHRNELQMGSIFSAFMSKVAAAHPDVKYEEQTRQGGGRSDFTVFPSTDTPDSTYNVLELKVVTRASAEATAVVAKEQVRKYLNKCFPGARRRVGWVFVFHLAAGEPRERVANETEGDANRVDFV